MKRIIVPTDFSNSAWNAFLYAAKLAEKINAELIIINSYMVPRSGAANIISIRTIMKEDSEGELKNWMKKIKETGIGDNLVIKEKSIYGSLVDTLKSQIKDYGDQLIVMGSLGETGSLEKIMGSNTSKVVAKVKCPVFVIPLDATFSFSRRIIFAADFSNVPENINLKLLKELCFLHPADKLDFVHVVETSKDAQADHIKFDVFLKDIPFSHQMISGSDVADTLDKYVTQSKTDLLVLIKKKKGLYQRIFQESVTKKLTLSAKIPLLILKAKEE